MDSRETETETYKCTVDVTLRSNKPVVGCEIKPFVSVRLRSEGQQLPLRSHSNSVHFRWYRERKVCSVHHDKLATFQCVSCVKLNIPRKESYHCSTSCFLNSWKTHLQRHCLKMERGTLTDGKQTIRKLRSSGSWPEFDSECLINEKAAAQEEEKEWLLVSFSKNYVPKLDDLGLILKLECVAVDISTNATLSDCNVTVTDPVIEFPAARPRCMVQIQCLPESLTLCSTSLNGIAFNILSYNILSDMYTNNKYHYCPPWALVWEYRCHNLLREIIGYNADIICLQEVQSDHFENFFKPELRKEGYKAMYKKRNNEVFTGNEYVTDGCATFYRYDLFKEVAKYEVEFNKKTSPVVEALKPELRKEASIRLTKDNVALVAILETLESCHAYNAFQSRICVVNTHLCSDPKFPDARLFQVATLTNELEKILQPEIPLLICGDFNSVPQSDPHTFMLAGRLEHSDDSIDPYGLYQHLKLDHRFSLASAYASFSLAVANQERKLGKFNPETKEPILTYFAPRFSKTLDYIFFTENSLKLEGVLELLDRKDLAAGLPSPLWSSDHIALMATFRILPKNHPASGTKQANPL